LRAIAMQTVLLTFASTILYFHQRPILREAVPDSGARTALLATVDLAVNLGGLAMQLLLTARIVTGLGVGIALAIVPAISLIGFGAMAVAPLLVSLIVLSIARRATHYGIERPAREVLFTTVPRDQKYKAKSFIDTVVYRGGDVVASWGYAGGMAAGLGLVGLSIAAVPICAAGVAVAIHLGRRRGGAETTREQGEPA
jgi:AAA family ATP:ADP antiporter